MVRRTVVLAFLILSLTYPTLAQITSATASTDKTDYLVGDYINYSIRIGYQKGLTVYAPSIQDSLKGVTIIKQEKPVETEKNGIVDVTYGYILSCYDSAGVTIPSIPIFYRAAGDTALSSVSINPVSFTVRTVAVNMKEGIKDVKQPIKIPFDWRWVLVWLAAALLAIALIHYLYRRYRKMKAASAPVQETVRISPHEAALNALHQLEEEKLWQRGMIKEYHSAITEIIRRYFEERFAMPAMELPTSEAVELLKRRPGSEPIGDLTYDFLSNADMVKFAKFTPMSSVNEEMMKQAYEIVNRTVPSDGSSKNHGEGNVR